MADSLPDHATLLPDEQEKLRDLTAQSWNLELVISGAALFAILQLPDLLDEGFTYLQYNFMLQVTGVQGMLPALAHSVLNVTCYVLFLAFLTNFVMRAFWVGLVGLLAVYPEGIRYDKLPFSTPYSQQRMADELGPLDRYVLRLDKRCNVVFAVAFLFVIFLIIIAFAYLLILLVTAVLRPLLSVDTWGILKLAVFALLILYFLVTIVLNLPKIKTHPLGVEWHYKLLTLSRLMGVGMYKPYMFIMNTFYSHVPTDKILRTMGVFMVVFFVMLSAESISSTSRADRRLSTSNQRYLYSSRLDSLFSNPSAYDDQLPDGEYVAGASIQSDVVREPFIRLFVAYPKALDTLLTGLVREPAWNDALPRAERRRQYAEWSHGQMTNLMQISINDSVYRRPDLLFAQRGSLQQRGWQTVLIPANLRTGKNTIRVSLKADDPLAKPHELAMIPFWYVPDK